MAKKTEKLTHWKEVFNWDLTIQEKVYLELTKYSYKTPKSEKHKALLWEAKEAAFFIHVNLKFLHFNRLPEEPFIQYSYQLTRAGDKNNISREQIEKILFSKVVITVVNKLLLEIEKAGKKERLHKQPRSLLKTVAQRISNTTEEPTLFTLPQKLETGGGAIGDLKEEISKNTGALAYYLIQKYQENNNKPLEVTNLNEIAEVMNCNNYRLKLFLLYLGGYVYPIIDRDERTKELILTNEQLFKIEFIYSEQVANKYSVNTRGEIQGVERIGTNILDFIKDEPVHRVIITPSERFIKALEGRGLGNILTVNNKFVGLILKLTDIATKILSYSSSNKPSLTIGEDNFIKQLGLTKQMKKQGKPRIRATILKGFEELKEKGHIKSYSYEAENAMYSYTYSDKYVKYKQNKGDKKQAAEGVQ
jgi:hypothetical protein